MLKDILSDVGERQRQFLLLRITGTESGVALSTLQIPIGTYRRWVTQKKFQVIYRQLGDLAAQYRDEALMMLRATNYALVVKLEEDMLNKLIEEVAQGTPKFTKTNLAREIYARLANEMSTKTEIRSVATWEQMILQQQDNAVSLGTPVSTDGESHDYIEAETSQIEESTESQPEEDNLRQDIPSS